MSTPQTLVRSLAMACAMPLASGLAFHAQAQNGDGLRPSEAPAGIHLPGSGWKGRIGMDWSTPSADTGWNGLAGSAPSGLKLSGLRLLGDYYFAPRSGFRATGGLLRGSLGQPWMVTGATGETAAASLGWRSGLTPGSGTGLRLPADEAATASVPYLGAGYSLDLNQTWGGNWSFSADIGLIALNAGSAVQLGRVFTGGQNLDDLLHDLRLRPVIQFGVSYSY